MAMQLGASLPIGDFGAGPAIVRDYAQAAEGLGYDFLCAPDHVLGVDPAKISAGGPRMGSNATAYHDPFVLFGYLSGLTKKIEFVAGVLILAQRQAWASASAGTKSNSRGLATTFTPAASARRSRCGSCRSCGPSRPSPSRASSTS